MIERRRFPLALAAGLLAVALTALLLFFLREPSRSVWASPGVLCVAPGGTGCDVGVCGAPCYGSVQDAVDAAAGGDEIRVAAGTYTGVHVRDGFTQVVYISQTVVVRGGYTTTNWTNPDPVVNPTILDADGQGRVVCIRREWFAPEVSPTLEGLRLTNGVSSLSGGGGVYAFRANLTISGCQIYGNSIPSGSAGGGVDLSDTNGARLINNRIYSNTAAAGSGGGIHLSDSDRVTLMGNELYDNVAGRGGGIHCLGSDQAKLTGNRIYANRAASYEGGGIYAANCDDLTLSGNQVYSNTAQFDGGGASIIDSSNSILVGNLVLGNEGRDGGGLDLSLGDHITLVNNLVADNRATRDGSGVFVEAAHVRLLHTTVARNSGGDGSGIHVEGYLFDSTYYTSTVVLTNTILVSHTVGITVTEGATNSAVLNGVLWYGNSINTGGPGSISVANGVAGAPAFLDPDGGDYHIGFGSAARDAGVVTLVGDDIDGDRRPFGSAPDLGADEHSCLARVNAGPTLYGRVQDAVDAATDGDTVLVAGTCRGVETHSGHSEVVYIHDKSLTLLGGFSDDLSTLDPQAYPTTLDAQGEGRPVYISSDCTPTLQLLHLVNGAVDGAGGGLYAFSAHPIIYGCQIHGNSATQGGGAYLTHCERAELVNNMIYDNQASNNGGGLGIQLSDDIDLDNNIVAGNRIGGSGVGSGISVFSQTAYFAHTTVAQNRGGQGPGIHVYGDTFVFMVNTIVVSHTVGIRVGSGSEAVLVATLWGAGSWANETPWQVHPAGDLVTSPFDVWDYPRFQDPGEWDYHLSPGSAAIDAGVGDYVSYDIDWESRPMGLAPDLGADEAWAWVFLPLVLRGY